MADARRPGIKKLTISASRRAAIVAMIAPQIPQTTATVDIIPLFVLGVLLIFAAGRGSAESRRSFFDPLDGLPANLYHESPSAGERNAFKAGHADAAI
jgi:hypothetical protein